MTTLSSEEFDGIFSELKEQHPIDEMVKFSELDIAEKLQQNAMKVVEYKEFYYRELNLYEQLERKMDALTGIRYKHYKYNDEHNWQKPEIEKYCLPADESIIKLKKIMMKQQIRVRFFELCWKSFEKQGWNMKVFSDRERMGI
jgi:hypothetical protein